MALDADADVETQYALGVEEMESVPQTALPLPEPSKSKHGSAGRCRRARETEKLQWEDSLLRAVTSKSDLPKGSAVTEDCGSEGRPTRRVVSNVWLF